MGKKVYVNKEKMQILQCCDLPQEYASLLTTDHLETNIHAVSAVRSCSRRFPGNVSLFPTLEGCFQCIPTVERVMFHPYNPCQVPLFKINAQEMSGILEN